MTAVEFRKKYNVTAPACTYYAKKFNAKKDGSINYTLIDVELQDRINIVKLTQDLLADKRTIDVANMLNIPWTKAKLFITNLYRPCFEDIEDSSKVLYRDVTIDKCNEIISILDNFKDDE